MPKDRLNDLKKARTKKDEVIDVEVVDDTNNLKTIFDRAEVLRQWVEAIEENVQQIHDYLKNSNININQKDVQDRLDSLFQNNNSISHKAMGKLKEFAEILKTANLDSAEGRITNIQYNTLQTRYHKVLEQNNTELENYKNIQKRILEAQIKAKGINVTDEQLETLLEAGTDAHIFTENILAETAEEKLKLAAIEDRHNKLIKIENMLVDMRDMFVQMSILVDVQQELLNRVEYQAQAATEYVQAVDLKSVVKSRNKHIKCKIYVGLAIVLILIIICILIFK